jgi:transglutaminase-like putative cysteine protease
VDAYLQSTEIINWQHPSILERAKTIAASHQTPNSIAQACFEWVRDEIYHSGDYQMNPVTCRASDVLQHQTGFCYAKSHLLAALLRANGIPAGFCYQRLSIDDRGAPFCLHGFNAIYLPETGWYRVDARGNRDDMNAQFAPPQEHLAYQPKLPGEVTFQSIFAEPIAVVVQALQTNRTLAELGDRLPDLTPEEAEMVSSTNELRACVRTVHSLLPLKPDTVSKGI